AHSLNDAPVFRNELDASTRGLPGFLVVQRLAFEPHFASAKLGIVEARNRPARRGLARTVSSQKGENLALPQVQIHALDDIAFAVIGVEIAHSEELILCVGLDWGGRSLH